MHPFTSSAFLRCRHQRRFGLSLLATAEEKRGDRGLWGQKMGGSWEIEIPSGHGGCFNTSRHGLMSRHMTWMICRLISDFLGIMYINYTLYRWLFPLPPWLCWFSGTEIFGIARDHCIAPHWHSRRSSPWKELLKNRKTGRAGNGWRLTLWLCQNSYWKWPLIVDFPIKNGDFP